LYSQYLEEPYEFSSLVGMMGKMEDIFDAKKFPQAFLRPRTFMDNKVKPQKARFFSQRIRADNGHSILDGAKCYGVCTFDIHVRFRKNASWQGRILWVEKDLTREFLSELDMLKLMDQTILEVESDYEKSALDEI